MNNSEPMFSRVCRIAMIQLGADRAGILTLRRELSEYSARVAESSAQPSHAPGLPLEH